MQDKIALSDQFEERLIEFAARIIRLAGRLPKNFQGRHVANQILRSGTAGAPNYAEARGAESRADFIHKMRIVQKELNETAVWIRIMAKSSLISPDLLVDILAENKELCRMASASIRTAGVVRPPSVRIRIEHWELNIGQTPIEHSAKLFLREPSVRPFSHQRHRRDQLRAIRPPRWAVLLRTSTERLGRVEISIRVHRELVHAPECARERPVSSP